MPSSLMVDSDHIHLVLDTDNKYLDRQDIESVANTAKLSGNFANHFWSIYSKENYFQDIWNSIIKMWSDNGLLLANKRKNENINEFQTSKQRQAREYHLLRTINDTLNSMIDTYLAIQSITNQSPPSSFQGIYNEVERKLALKIIKDAITEVRNNKQDESWFSYITNTTGVNYLFLSCIEESYSKWLKKHNIELTSDEWSKLQSYVQAKIPLIDHEAHKIRQKNGAGLSKYGPGLETGQGSIHSKFVDKLMQKNGIESYSYI